MSLAEVLGEALQAEPDAHGYNESRGEVVDIATPMLQTLEWLGTGNAGQVYKGIYEGRGFVAIKAYSLKAMNDDQRQSMARELTILSKVRHPNLLEFIETVMEDDYMKAILEYCEGGSLYKVLRSDFKIAWRQKSKIASDVAEAMKYLHSMDPKIIHRDLKSMNLLLFKPLESSMQMPEIKVTDFGLSRTLEPAGIGTPLTFGVGTTHWMAPELIEGVEEYSEKVDLYSFAMILYELLSESVPYGTNNGPRLALHIVSGKRPALENIPPDAPDILVTYMTQCWAGNPEERPEFTQICIGLQVLSIDENRLAALDAFADSWGTLPDKDDDCSAES